MEAGEGEQFRHDCVGVGMVEVKFQDVPRLSSAQVRVEVSKEHLPLGRLRRRQGCRQRVQGPRLRPMAGMLRTP